MVMTLARIVIATDWIRLFGAVLIVISNTDIINILETIIATEYLLFGSSLVGFYQMHPYSKL
jgi:hypothetical protein